VSREASRGKEVIYTFHFAGSRNGRKESTSGTSAAMAPIPRIARLMALAIRFEGLVREQRIQDYAELARLGSVTRGRMTQIMQLLHLAPDIQEQLLFRAETLGLNERNLRPIVSCTDWTEQRRMFEKITPNRTQCHCS
jgi:hypothetical protein